MATMISEIYDALKEAGASEEKARKAAEAVASQDAAIAAMRTDIATLTGKVNLLQWMVTFNLAMTVAILWKVFAG